MPRFEPVPALPGILRELPTRYSLGFMRLNFRLESDISGLVMKPDTDSIGPFRQRGTFFLISAPKNEPTSAVFLFIEISVRYDRTWPKKSGDGWDPEPIPKQVSMQAGKKGSLLCRHILFSDWPIFPMTKAINHHFEKELYILRLHQR